MDRALEAPEIAGPLGSLALSQVRPHASSASLRAVQWHKSLGRLGLDAPFFLVHDLGLALTAGELEVELGSRADVADRAALDLASRYRELLEEVRASETARRAGPLAMSDDLVSVVLARVLGDVAREVRAAPKYRAELPPDATLFERLGAESLGVLWGRLDRAFEREWLARLCAERLLVLTLVDALDLDTLRLFRFAGVSERGALAQVELLDALETPEANDIVNFSLELLPSVLETKTRRAPTTFASFGYAGLSRRGSVDNLVLTELAWDDAELARRMADNEVLYYARENEQTEEQREHILCVDASASMRGDRSTFARAMALATGKKLLLEGERVSFRFFDSRLYEAHAAHGQELPTAYLLAFRGERGRNPARVFSELRMALDLARHTQPPVVHLFTHAALYIPRPLVQEVRRLAELAAVFILPSGGALDLDYLDLLSAHWVVDHHMLAGGKTRTEAALGILGAPASQARPTGG